MWKDSSKFGALLIILLSAFAQKNSAQTTVGFELIAQSDKMYEFDILTSDKWVDGQQKTLFRSIGYPEPSQVNFAFGHSYLYSIHLQGTALKAQFVLTDSFQTGPVITGDFDADGNIEIMGNASFYPGEGTEILTLRYVGGIWKEYREAIPYYILGMFSVDLFDDSGDDFVFAFVNDTTTVCDTCFYDNENPETGLIFGNWDGQKLNLSVDSTFHYALQSLGAVFGANTYVYTYEALIDSTYSPEEGAYEYGCLVKYRFDQESAKLERLYYAECPYFGWGLPSDNTSGVYVRDSLIVILDNKAMQWFVDDGQSLNLALMQWTPFPCYNPVLFDINADGQDDLVCAEPVVAGSLVQDPNWVIKAYKILK